MTLRNSQGALYPLSILVVSLFVIAFCRKSRDGLVSIVTGLRPGHAVGSNLTGTNFSTTFEPALEPTWPPVGTGGSYPAGKAVGA
jgi:hypothetical protein